MAKKAAKATAKKSRASETDRCQPIRAQIETTKAEIANIEESLSDHDILESIKRRLRALLPGLKALLKRLREALKECEKLPKHPLDK